MLVTSLAGYNLFTLVSGICGSSRLCKMWPYSNAKARASVVVCTVSSVGTVANTVSTSGEKYIYSSALLKYNF